jgi:Protein of unknown function (DUF2975)
MRAMGRASISSLLMVLLNAAWYLCAAGLVIGGALTLTGVAVGVHIDADGPSIEAGPNVTVSIPVSLRVEGDTHRVTAPSLGIDNAELDKLRGALKFPPRRGPLLVANLLVFFGSLALAMWVIGQLRGFFRTLRDRKPFVPANAMRLRRVAWAVIFGEVARATIIFFESYYAMTHFTVAGLRFDPRPELNVFAIVNGLIILVIAEVFREGTRLDEEQSLTI